MRQGCATFLMLCLVGACGAASAQERNASPSAGHDGHCDQEHTGCILGADLKALVAGIRASRGHGLQQFTPGHRQFCEGEAS
jgi:hypothetical protein